MARRDQPRDAPVERLVLDLGGVVLTSAMPRIVAELAGRSGRSEQSLWRYFNDRLFHPFWGGAMDVETFWAEFTAHAGVPGIEGRWQRELVPSMLGLRLPAATVRRWAARVPVGVLSNQRAEWVRPVLEREGLLEVLGPVFISSETGLLKPAEAAFAQLTVLGTPAERILYVDDRPQAVHAARAMGIAAIQADTAGTWADRVDERLGTAP
ncbi:MAG: HAD hydrolase-like protein [Thermoleophilia bacterium]|nr:HAD hydrolase-like protein [Thermoleophilia bacterium]